MKLVLMLLANILTASLLLADALTMATWVERTAHTLYYSIYNGTTWTSPALIDGVGSLQGQSNIFTAYDSTSGTTVAVWGSATTVYPYYAVYNGTSWTTPQVISSNTSIKASDGVVFVCLNSNAQTFMAVWTDNATGRPYYSKYNGTSWSAPAVISSNGSLLAYHYVFACYSPTIDKTIATWADSTTQRPYYSLYDGSSWSTPTPIGDAMDVVNQDVYPAYNAATGYLTVTYGHQTFIYPYASIYNGTNWTTPVRLTSDQAYNDVFASYESTGNTVVATWAGNTDHYPAYSTYDGSSWSASASITTASLARDDVFVSYNSTLRSTIATWSELTSNFFYPTFSTYNGTSWSAPATITTSVAARNLVVTTLNGPLAPPDPPTNLRGIQLKNNFGTVYEMYNQLSWTLSDSDGVAGYYVYVNGVRIAALPANATKYQNNNIVKGISSSYSVTAFSAQGTESDTATVVVQGD